MSRSAKPMTDEERYWAWYNRPLLTPPEPKAEEQEIKLEPFKWHVGDYLREAYGISTNTNQGA